MPHAVTPAPSAPARALAARGFHHGNLRQALLDAALAAADIEGLSLRQLAAGVGVTPAAAYRHFASREDLLLEVARIGFDRLHAFFAAAFDIERPPHDAAEAQARLQALARAYLGFADAEPALWRLMFGAQAAEYRSTAAPRARRHGQDYLLAALAGLHRAGVAPAPPDERDALFAWSAIHGAAALRGGRVPGAMLPLDELACEVARRVVRSMRLPAGPHGD
ncbi:MAG: TetR/AcrR family transcriptional regulator [Burkholderiaceae bacterium]|jgi:AcrR family transcriptional regulator|nr:TetR/AcrR family transcriptional regulator [Burkholderiaceae bacterium]MCZ8175535.1 TetR/AcrR family transcriptional regulator [Burkholderiaceae bacterium]